MGIRPEPVSKGFPHRELVAQQFLVGAAGTPLVPRHPLSAVIVGKGSLALSSVIPAGEFFVRVVNQQRIVRYRALCVVLVVGAVVALFLTLVEAGVQRQGALVIDLERSSVQMLVVARELLVHLHFHYCTVLVPARARYHPAERPSAVNAEGKVVRFLAFEGKVPPQQLVYEQMRFHDRLALELGLQIGVVIIARRQHHGIGVCGYGPATVVHVACGQHLSVRTAAVDEVVHHQAHVVAVDGTGSHLVQYPHRQEVVGETHVGIACALVVVVP